MRSTALTSLLFSLALLSPREARADDEKPRYFYRGRDFGSEALYNPLSVALNRGYDVLQVRVGSRDLLRLSYAQDASNVAENLFVHPLGSVRQEGVWKFAREELLPLSFTDRTGRWVPNYSLHLIGGGQTYAALTEWYEAHDLPLAPALSATTVLGIAMLNETLENKGATGRNTDAIADFYFFDIGGIVLFSFESVRRFFSDDLMLADWSPQPSFTYPGLELHNHGQYFAAKVPLPLTTRLRAFSYFGMSTLFGFSYRLDGSHSLSLAAGQRASRLIGEGGEGVHNSVQFTETAGLFFDRDNSLLASLQISHIPDYFLHLNVYPGALSSLSPSLSPGLSDVGFWAVVDTSGRPILGLSTRLGVGMGVSSSHR